MKSACASAMLLSWIFTIVSQSAAYGVSEAASTKWRLQPLVNRIYPGEPFAVRIICEDVNTVTAVIRPAMEVDGITGMYVIDANDCIAAEGMTRLDDRKYHFVRQIDDSAWQITLVVNGWCTTLLDPGIYELVVEFSYRLATEDSIEYLGDGVRTTSQGPIHSVCIRNSFAVVPMNITAFGKRLDEIYVLCHSKSAADVDRLLAAEMLALAEGPTALPYQLRLLRERSAVMSSVMASLSESNSLEAAKGLVAILEGVELEESDVVQADIRKAVFCLRRKGNPAILDVTKEFAAKYPEPPRDRKPRQRLSVLPREELPSSLIEW